MKIVLCIFKSFFLLYAIIIFVVLTERYRKVLLVIFILSPLFALLSVSFIVVVIQNRRNRLKHKKEIFSREMSLRKMIQSHNKDEMEIEPCNVELFEVLGEGAFGIVRKGFLKPTNKSIAVKMLKGENYCITVIWIRVTLIFDFRKCRYRRSSRILARNHSHEIRWTS